MSSKIAQLEKKVRDMQAEISKLHLEEHKTGHGNCPHCGVCKCCGRNAITYQWYLPNQWIAPNYYPYQLGTLQGTSLQGGTAYGTYTNASSTTAGSTDSTNTSSFVIDVTPAVTS